MYSKISAKKRLLLITLLGLNIATTYSQGITEGLEKATENAKEWVDSFTGFLWVLAAIVAIGGSYKVFQKYQAQDNDTMKAAMTWAGGFVFIVLANIIIKAVFEI